MTGWIRDSRFVRAAVGCASLLLAPVSHAQECDGRWLPGGSVPGIIGEVSAVAVWDPDGPGPDHARLVVGGRPTTAGDVIVRGVAVWDPLNDRWSALPGTTDSQSSTFDVRSCAAAQDGSLLVGGTFVGELLGDASVSGIARWNGSTWDALGGGVLGSVWAVAVLSNGDVVAAGAFAQAGGVAAENIARWDGAAWHPLGTGMNGSVYALAVMPNGDLIAGGEFTTAGGAMARRIARWNGAAWTQVGSGVSGSNTLIRALAVAPSGDLLAGGDFTAVGGVGANNIARWNGSAWSPLGSGTSSSVLAVAVLPNGDVVAGGVFSLAGGGPVPVLARWDGSTWSSFAGFYTGDVSGYSVRSIAVLPNEDVVVGGGFSRAGFGDDWPPSGVPAYNIARWSGSHWSALTAEGSEPVDGFGGVDCLAVLPSGDVVVGGGFTHIGDIAAPGLAKWDGACWTPLPGQGSLARALRVLSDGRLLGAVTLGGLERVALWDGSDWTALRPDAVFDWYISSLLELPDGRIVVGGAFDGMWYEGDDGWEYVEGFRSAAIWNGDDWEPLGQALNGLDVRALAWLPGTGIVAGVDSRSSDISVPSGLFFWNNGEWEPLAGGAAGPVRDVATTAEGALIVAGGFTTVGGGTPARRVAMWDGASWSAMGTTVPQAFIGGRSEALAVLPNGDVVATGDFFHWPAAPSSYGQRIARWDGTTWQRFGDGILNIGRALAVHPSGEILVAGEIFRAGGQASFGLARWTDTGTPWVARPPQGVTLRRGQTLALSATPARRYEDVSVQWLRDGEPVADGAGGASVGGGVVGGASGETESPTAGNPAVLSIACIEFSDAGAYTVRFSNDCGHAVSAAAVVTVVCSADFDLNGSVEVADIFVFLSLWFGGEPEAYAFGGTPGVAAIFAFLIEWFTPCP